jgi:hypothetical protein
MKNFFKNIVNTSISSSSNSSVTINGVSFKGNNVTIINGKVIIDGKDQTPDAKNITIHVNGDISKLSVDICDSLSVTGNVNELSTVSGDVSVGGSVGQNVKTVSGDVKCGDIAGKVTTVSGDIKNKNNGTRN